ncbi:MAG TPA: C39 family peptidase [Chloroflexia bacterium]|nr:C39 family peptidase [Chloroflexia bacterium]
MLWTNTTRFVLPQIVDGRPATSARYTPEAAYELAIMECAGEPFTELVLSWNADTPPGTGLALETRVRYAAIAAPPEAATWSAWRHLGHWGAGSRAGLPLPRSMEDGRGADPVVRVDIDVLRLETGFAASAFQVRLALYGGDASPTVRLLAASTADRGRRVVDAAHDPPLGQAVHLPVPPRSQRVEHPTIAGDICSPTSLGMVLQFYGMDQPTAQVAQAVFDHGAAIYGNWPFNAAYAGSQGLRALVRHFGTMGEIERALQQGHPVIVSIAFEAGELPESPIARSAGHLIVVTGVTAAGDFLVNDPAAHPDMGEAIARVYGRDHLRAVFLRHGGIGYVLEPEPAGPLAGPAPGAR